MLSIEWAAWKINLTSISVNDLKYLIGSLLFHIHHGTGVFSNNNPFPFTSSSEIGAY